jgi:hypothetical protein
MPAQPDEPPERVQRLLSEFAKQPGVTPQHTANLTGAIAHTPELIRNIEAAGKSGDLWSLRVLPGGRHEGGLYDPGMRRILLPLRELRKRAQRIAFVVGHEVQHAHNRLPTALAVREFREHCVATTRVNGDQTSNIATLLAAHRLDEATANLAGWNSVISHMRQEHPDLKLREVFEALGPRADSFVRVLKGRPRVRDGLRIEPDLTFQATSANIEAMAQNYFDQAPTETRIGAMGTSDYKHHYAAAAISIAAQIHRQIRPDSPMKINFAELGLSRQILEENGIDLGSRRTQPYLDIGTDPPTPGTFHNTITTHEYQPVAPATASRPTDRTTEHRTEATRLAGASFARPPAAAMGASGPACPPRSPVNLDPAMLARAKPPGRGSPIRPNERGR